jgi:hypothetical protein
MGHGRLIRRDSVPNTNLRKTIIASLVWCGDAAGRPWNSVVMWILGYPLYVFMVVKVSTLMALEKPIYGREILLCQYGLPLDNSVVNIPGGFS